MAHLTTASVAAVVSHTAHSMPTNTYTPAHSVQTNTHPQLNITDEDPLYREELPGWDPCWAYHEKQKEDKKKALQLKLAPFYPPPWLQEVLEPSRDTRGQWNKCHLLSLPKEIRLKIWEYALTDPSRSNLLVGIDRKPFSPYYKHTKAPTPNLSFFHAECRNPVSINLLLASRAIYEEALPVLYQSVRFMPSDHEGLLPLFLKTLSPYARSCIRHIYLCFPKQLLIDSLRPDRSKPFFHWAVTCAQVAQLNDTLHQVEVEGDWSIFEKIANRRGLLFPLCKIRARKVFVPCTRGDNNLQDYDAAFQQLLAQAEQALKATAKLRKERTKAEAIERAERDMKREAQEKEEEKARVRTYPTLRSIYEPQDGSMEEWCRWAEENLKRMEKDLSTVPGIKQFEKELEAYGKTQSQAQSGPPMYKIDGDASGEDWDIVSMRSGASTPKARPASVISKYSDETWPDTASTLVGRDEADKEQVNKGDESDAESESWECVE